MANEGRFNPAASATAWMEALESGNRTREIAEYITKLEIENDRGRREAIELRRRLAEREGSGAPE